MQVNVLVADSSYYYTVLPIGVSGAVESNAIQVHHRYNYRQIYEL